ncbi:hypothetical protein [Ferrovibrio sp.]
MNLLAEIFADVPWGNVVLAVSILVIGGCLVKSAWDSLSISLDEEERDCE